jgi:hypothetical protein
MCTGHGFANISRGGWVCLGVTTRPARYLSGGVPTAAERQFHLLVTPTPHLLMFRTNSVRDGCSPSGCSAVPPSTGGLGHSDAPSSHAGTNKLPPGECRRTPSALPLSRPLYKVVVHL